MHDFSPVQIYRQPKQEHIDGTPKGDYRVSFLI